MKTNCLCDSCRLAQGEPPCPVKLCERPTHSGNMHYLLDEHGIRTYFSATTIEPEKES